MHEDSETTSTGGTVTRETAASGTLRRAATGALVALLVVSAAVAAVGPVAASDASQEFVASDEAAFVVDLQQDGSADITLRLTYDLTTQNETESFESLRNDSQAQTELRDRFENRMQSVAADASNVTGREMRVTDASISLRTSDDGNTGIVSLSVTYEGLAAVDGDTLTVTEPFASGYVTNQAFVIRAPDGYSLPSVSPSAAQRSDSAAMWTADTNLDGFEVTAEPSETATTTKAETGGGIPGFGVAGALVAIAAVVSLARRR